LQIWIFPDKRNVEPRYAQSYFEPEERLNKLQTLVSPIDKEDAGLKIHQDAWIYRTTLKEGASLQHKLQGDKHGLYAFLIEGKVSINGNVLNKRDALGLTKIELADIIAETDSDLLLLEVPMTM